MDLPNTEMFLSYFKWSLGLLSAVLQVNEELLQMVSFQIWLFKAGFYLSQIPVLA